MGRLRGLIIFIGGVVLMVMGLGMWQSPEFDWQGFLAAWSSVINDIARLVHDPFALLGIVVMLIGFLIVVNGVRLRARMSYG